ncbi:MAG: DUF5320 domain-containing protein [bacterium]|nr:DUF5320 domain-containing protein [bacterium]
MPGFNGTGPMGMGPRTGGGFGFCSPGTGSAFPGPGRNFIHKGAGRGFAPRGGGRGRVFGGGRGRSFLGYGRRGEWFGMGPICWDYYPGGSYGHGRPATDEKPFLEEQLSSLKKEIEAVRSRIGELEKKPGE